MGISLSLAEFSIALGTATVIAVGVILTVTKMLIGQVLRSIKESEARQEKSQTENETRYFDDLQEIKSVMKQMNGRIDDLAHAMYDINGQLQRIVGYLGMEEIIVEKKPRTRRRSEMPWSPAPPLSTP